MTLKQHQSNAAKARAASLTKARRQEIAAMGGRAKALNHKDRKSFKKWGKPSRTMTDTKAAIEKRKAASKSFRVGRNNAKGDPYQLSNP